MSTITTEDGCEICFKNWGTGQPMVFSHGWPLSADAWEDQVVFLAAAAATDSDRSDNTMLSAEFDDMQNLSELYLAIRKQDTFISTDNFNGSSLEDQILNCAREFVSMTESHEFQDQPACHY
jgi:hypothetical protein